MMPLKMSGKVIQSGSMKRLKSIKDAQANNAIQTMT
jgi:hypothetical protein